MIPRKLLIGALLDLALCLALMWLGYVLVTWHSVGDDGALHRARAWHLLTRTCWTAAHTAGRLAIHAERRYYREVTP